MDPVEVELGQKAFMGYSIECLDKVEYPDVELLFSILVIHEFVGGKEKLGLTGLTLAESVIGQCQDALVIYVIRMQTQNVFCEFTHEACQ